MTNEDFKNNEFAIMQECWAAYKKYYVITDTDEYWDAMMEAFTAIITKYSGNQFAVDLAEFFISDIDRRFRNG